MEREGRAPSGRGYCPWYNDLISRGDTLNPLEQDSQRVRAETPLEGGSIRFIADNIQKERTGIHARLSIAWNTTLLAYSFINIERDGDRTTLANKAWALLPPPVRAGYTKDVCKHEVDIFTFRLWDAYLGQVTPEQANGQLDGRPVEFVLRPYIQEGAGTILFGPPGRGKSYVLMLMAVTVDSGGSADWWESPVRKGMFVNLERSRQSVLHRLARVNLCLGYEANRDLWMLNARGHTLMDVRDAIKKAVEEQGIEIVFLDSISRAGMGDLTGNREANAIVDVLNQIAPTWIAIGHTPRQDDTHLFGGVHFDAGADIMVKLASEQTPTSLGIALEVTKANDMGKPPRPEYLALDFDLELGLSAVRRPSKAEFIELEASFKLSLKEEVVAFLMDIGKATATSIATETKRNRQNISSLLTSDPNFVFVERTREGAFYGLRHGE